MCSCYSKSFFRDCRIKTDKNINIPPVYIRTKILQVIRKPLSLKITRMHWLKGALIGFPWRHHRIGNNIFSNNGTAHNIVKENLKQFLKFAGFGSFFTFDNTLLAVKWCCHRIPTRSHLNQCISCLLCYYLILCY